MQENLSITASKRTIVKQTSANVTYKALQMLRKCKICMLILRDGGISRFDRMPAYRFGGSVGRRTGER